MIRAFTPIREVATTALDFSLIAQVAMTGVVRYRTLSARNEVHALGPAATVTAPQVAPSIPPRTFAATATRAQLHDEEGPATATAPAMDVPMPGAVTVGSPQATTPETPAPVSLGDVDVVVYTTSWCPACKQAKSWMNARGMAYDERDVEASVAYSRELHSLNPRGSIPTFDVEGQVLVGFSDCALVRAMEQAARRRAERRNY
jgi:glutaredoxin 3